MMISYLLLFTLHFQADQPKAVYIVEEVRLEMPNALPEVTERHIYVSLDRSKRVRVDLPDQKMRFIYDLPLRRFIIADMKEKTYYLSRTGQDKDVVRSPLRGISVLKDGFLDTKIPVAIKTGKRKIISGEECEEFRLNYPAKYKMQTSIWTTNTSWLEDKEVVKHLWFAALSTKPPSDVRAVITKLKNKLKGLPIQISSTIQEADFKITTTSTITKINRHLEVSEDFFDIPHNFEIVSFKGKNSSN